MTSGSASYFYRVYGLTIQSEMRLPQLMEIRQPYEEIGEERLSLACDVEIELGEVFDHFPGFEPTGSWAEYYDDQCLLRIDGAGRFLVSAGNRVLLQKQSDASDQHVNAWLLGSVLAALAHQRKLLPLHVSAVLFPHGVIAFTGGSGAGKSTMAAHINASKRWPLISDDVSVVTQDQSGFLIESGVHTVKLWTDALTSLDRSSEGLHRDLVREDKFHAIDRENFVSGEFRLDTLVNLRWGDEYRVETLSGKRAFQVALAAIYRPELAQLCGNSTIIEKAMSLAGGVTVLELTRPKHADVAAGVIESIDRLESHLTDIWTGSSKKRVFDPISPS